MLLGIDLGATNVRVGRVLQDNIETMEHALIDQTDDPDTLINQIVSLIETSWHPAIKSIGVGVPSVVDVEKGIVYDVQNIPSWKEVHLKDILEERFSVLLGLITMQIVLFLESNIMDKQKGKKCNWTNNWHRFWGGYNP